MHLRYFSLSLLFILLSSTPHPSTSTATNAGNRRVLHQPFFPQTSPPPSQPPSPQPPIPKYPFSSSSPPQPFFPTVPSPPPPPSPPSPSTAASFPANISSLILPHSSKSKATSKLVAVAVALSVAAVIVTGISIFLYVRRRERRSFSDCKTHRSDNSNGAAFQANVGLPKPRRSAPNSSEFLYLGNIVNSHGVDPRAANRGGGASAAGDLRKLDSPELRPLPPLGQQNFRQNRANAGSGSAEEEDYDEFYSPRGSLGGRESSIGTGSSSRRAFAAVAAGDLDARGSESSSSSSSNSGSPTRSVSLSISPPGSSSPRSSRPKSPELVAVENAQAASSPPPRQLTTQFSNKGSSPSPSPPSSSSPERASGKSLDSSPRMSNAAIQIMQSPMIMSNGVSSHLASRENSRSPSLSPLSSPHRLTEKAQISNQFAGKSNSRSASLSSSSSPERFLEKNHDTSPRISKVSPSSVCSPAKVSNGVLGQLANKKNSRSPSLSSLSSPERTSSDLHSNAESPARISNAIKKPVQVSVTVPPPPPPPPPPGHWESPVFTPPVRQPISKPPVLAPSLRPFAVSSPPLISPIQLPSGSENVDKNEEPPKPKLKPLHWDKVRASSDREMVWDQLKSSSFKLNEEMIETLFVVKTPNLNVKESKRRAVLPSPNQENRVLDPKKAQNIAISLRALNVTIDEVCEALTEGNADALGTELLESLLKMAPTKEEERRLKEYKEDSPFKLGPAEKFLKAVLDIPFAFKRVDAMLYVANFESEVEYLKKSFDTLEAACEELRNSRMFLKLLEAVLKTGNRMNVGTNRGDAHAFKLDTLLKLVDVKGADGKTTLLHFVVQEIIRTEGARLSGSHQNPSTDDAKCRKLGLQVVSALSSELTNVKKAAAMDSDVLSSDVMKLSKGIGNIAEVVRLNVATRSEDTFSESMNRFMKMAEEEIIRIQAQESVAVSLVKEITEYFHGDSAKEEAHPFRIFMVVRDFLTVLDRVCKEVGLINEHTIVSSAHKFPVPVNPMLQPVIIPGFPGSRQYSSDDESSSS